MSHGCNGLNIKTQAGPLKDPGQTWDTKGVVAEPRWPYMTLGSYTEPQPHICSAGLEGWQQGLRVLEP